MNQKGCERYQKSQFVSSPIADAEEEMFFTFAVLVERGNCTFVTKAKHAQTLGANMVVIVDSLEEHSENLVMSDDGFGG